MGKTNFKNVWPQTFCGPDPVSQKGTRVGAIPGNYEIKTNYFHPATVHITRHGKISKSDTRESEKKIEQKKREKKEEGRVPKRYIVTGAAETLVGDTRASRKPSNSERGLVTGQVLTCVAHSKRHFLKKQATRQCTAPRREHHSCCL